MEAGSRAQSAGLAWLEQCQALLEANKASWPAMPILIRPRQLQELERKSDELHQELEGVDSDDEDSEAQRQAKQESLVALERELRPLKTDWDRTCRDAHVAYRPEDEMKANSLMNNLLNLYKDFGLPINGNMAVDTSALGLPGDSPDADPDTPRRPRMRVKRGGAVLTPDRNGVFEVRFPFIAVFAYAPSPSPSPSSYPLSLFLLTSLSSHSQTPARGSEAAAPPFLTSDRAFKATEIPYISMPSTKTDAPPRSTPSSGSPRTRILSARPSFTSCDVSITT